MSREKDRNTLKDRSTLEKLIKLEGAVEVLTSLHIGKGRALEAGALSDLPVIKDAYGNPFIPGSSLKGVIRSYVESVVRGLNSPNLRTCNFVDGENCIDPKKEDKKDPNYVVVLKNICDICNIFGHSFVASKVRFPDLSVVKDTWDALLLQARDGVVIDRESGTAKRGGKFDFEIIPAGVKFNCEIFFENPEDWELGLLFFALDAFENGYAFLGGNASRGPGKVKITVEKCRIFTPQNLLQGEKEEVTDFEKFKKECLEALRKKIGEKNDKPGTQSNL